MRLLICAGGTGGGVYPAIAVLQAMNNDRLAIKVMWVGSQGGMEAHIVKGAGIPFKSIPAAGVHGVSISELPRNLLLLARGTFAARKIIHEFNPDVMFFTGGYVAVPMALAGWRVPTLLYIPDVEPGLALKTLACLAKRIAVTTKATFHYFKNQKRLILTGYPVRSSLLKWTHDDARNHFQLSKDFPILLVFGGSKGARSINQAVLANLPSLLEITQIIHITGKLDWLMMNKKKKELTHSQTARYRAYPYLHDEMGAALAAVDLVLSRAGASTLGEYPMFGLPAILVPYPYAWHYQKINADYLIRCGAAELLEDSQLSNGLIPIVRSLLRDTNKLKAMGDAMRRLSQPQAATEISQALVSLAGKRS